MISLKIELKNTKNTRTLSNMLNKEGKVIKSNLLIRSDALHSIDDNDKNILFKDYQLSRVIDLRCDNEATNQPDQTIEGVEYILNSILPTGQVGISKKGNAQEDFYDFIETLQKNGIQSSIHYMEKIYSDIIKSEFSSKAYYKFIKTLLIPTSGATLWHCSAGKDRAGFATILVLYLLDFKLEDILEDYLATNDFYKENVQTLLKHFGSEYEEILWSVFGVRKEYIDIMLSTMDTTYGGLEGYIRHLGITDEDRIKLKEMYLGEK